MSSKADVAFMDVDMSCAHSKIARFLISDPNSVFGYSLKDPHFWATQVKNLENFYKESNIDISFNSL
jgi:hypothetical protein